MQSGCVGNNPNKMKLCSFITISIQVNTKVSYFFFKERVKMLLSANHPG